MVVAIGVVGLCVIFQGASPLTAPSAATTGGMPPGLAQAIRTHLAATNTTFNPVASLSVPSGSAGNFGVSVALSADDTTALVGSSGENGGAGAAYIFHSTAAGGWTTDSLPVTRLTAGDQGTHEHFGKSVAISADGATALVGAPGEGGDVGAVYVYRAASESSWGTASQVATLTDGANPHDGFGQSVALSDDGTTALIGAVPLTDSSISAPTYAYIDHVASESAWVSTGTPTVALSDGSSTSDLFGYAVSLSSDGTTALVGAPGSNYPNAQYNNGAAFVFHAAGEGSWGSAGLPVAGLTDGTTLDNQDDFGNAVALSADGLTAAIGAPGAGANYGAADVFHVAAIGAWADSSTPAATLTRPNPNVDDYLGYAVAISADGTTVLEGPGQVTSINGGSGAAYLFHVASAGAWVDSSAPTATLTYAGNENLGDGVTLSRDGTIALACGPNVMPGGELAMYTASSESGWTSSSTPHAVLTGQAPITAGVGRAVAVSGDGTTALIATTETDQRHGGAFVFHVSAPGSWQSSTTPTARLAIPGPTEQPSVAISADGTTAFVALPGSTGGTLYVFHATSEAAWSSSVTPVAVLPVNQSECLYAHVAVSRDGATVLFGCIGAAYVLRVPSEGDWSSVAPTTATLTDGASNDYFGDAVSLSADGAAALIGAPGTTNGSGVAYVFHVAAAADWATTSTPQAELAPCCGGRAGTSVALSPDGTTALVGAPGADSDTGAAYVFHASSVADWAFMNPQATLTNSAGAPGNDLGSSVAISANGTSAFVGSFGNGSSDGVFLFQAQSEGGWSSESSGGAALLAGDADAIAVSADRSIVAVGLGTEAADVFALPQEADTMNVTTAGSGTGVVTSSPAGIDCGSACSQTYPYGTTVSLTAIPAAGMTFGGWSGACTGTGNCTVTLSSAVNVTATFDPPPDYTLTVAKNGIGSGIVTSSPTGIDCGPTCTHDFVSGTKVTLTATPTPGLAFTGWSGACTGTGTCTITMSKAQTVTATFGSRSSPPPPRKPACVVPKAKGKTLKAAKRAIKAHHCRLGAVKRRFSGKVRRGRVISEHPKAGRHLAHAAKVRLVLSKGKR